MSSKCDKKCLLCQHEFKGRRHRHPEGWSEAVRSFFVQESGITLDTGEVVCVCGACDVSIRRALNARNEGEPYHLRWLSSISSCCVPACTSSIRVENHNYSWEMICQSIGIASISPPVDTSLCKFHYNQVYRMQHTITIETCVCCGSEKKHEHSVTTVNFRTCPNPKLVESYLRDTIQCCPPNFCVYLKSVMYMYDSFFNHYSRPIAAVEIQFSS